MQSIKLRLTVMSWLQFAVWGSYLTSMGGYLGKVGLGESIGWFYSVQGIVSIFMPALMGIVADRWIPAQRLLGLCHLLSAALMSYVGYVGMTMGADVTFTDIFPAYTAAVAFYMPTLALSNSVSYTALENAGLDTIKDFPPIRIFGTIGFIAAMWVVDLGGVQHSWGQFFATAAWGVALALYSLTLPACPTNNTKSAGLIEVLGLRAFSLFKDRTMMLFFIFSMLLGVSLQITNGYANPFISAFEHSPEFKGSFFVEHANMLISLSQISETLCILLIPFFLRRYGIKRVMLIAMLAWVLRFGFFAVGNPAWPGVTLLVLSMIVYGVAFDFFNISGSLFVDRETDVSIRSSAQGLFMLMTNGIGATIGTLSAQAVVNNFVFIYPDAPSQMHGWSISWAIFATYALIVALLFIILFRYKVEASTR